MSARTTGLFQGYLAGAGNGFVAGTLSGLYLGVRRLTVGAMEILTFWKPEFGPTIEPLYGTRDKSMAGPQDYFDPGSVVVQRADEINDI